MSLKSEAKKAARILQDFTMPNSKEGLDRIIPSGLLLNCKGLAILTVVKLGFLVTARGGSGIVIAKLPNGDWSAPSAIGIAGLGGGFEIGAEVTDFVIILNKKAAVEAFSKGGNMTLGGNLTVAAGPLGRNLEADMVMRSQAAIFTYSKTKGLFAGISIEGSGIIERKDANKKFYGYEVRAYEILQGQADRPPECAALYEVLERQEKMAVGVLQRAAKREAKKAVKKGVDKASEPGFFAKVNHGLGASFRRRGSKQEEKEIHKTYSSSSSSIPARLSPPKVVKRSAPKPASHSDRTKRSSWSPPKPSSVPRSQNKMAAPKPATNIPRSHSQCFRASPPQSYSGAITKSSSGWDLKSSSPSWDSTDGYNPPSCTVRALWDYVPQMSCDLYFRKGDIITVLTQTDRQDDWWEGTLCDKVGIFPANYTEIVVQ